MTMSLKQLMIRRPERWETEWKDGKLRGSIELDGLHSTVTVKLSDEQCHAIIAIIGQAAKDTTAEAVKAMSAEMFNLPTAELIEG